MTITLYNADCLEILPLIDPVDVCITSPPYNLNKNYGEVDDNKPWSEYSSWLSKVSSILKNKVKSHLFLNIGSPPSNPWLAIEVGRIFSRVGWILQNDIIWVKHIKVKGECHGIYRYRKSNIHLSSTYEHIYHFTHTGKEPVDCFAVSGEYDERQSKKAEASYKSFIKQAVAKKYSVKYRDIKDNPLLQQEVAQRMIDHPFVYNPQKDEGGVWYIPYPPNNDGWRSGHPAVFPIGLPLRCIEFSGAKQVLDPFMGVGTTGLACKQKGIEFVGIEMSEDYYEIARKRLYDYPV